MTQEVECYTTVTKISIRVNAKKFSLELLEIIIEELLLETSLDVFLVFLNGSLFLMNEEIFGGGLALATILH